MVTAQPVSFPRVHRNVRVDVAIIGGGIMGLTAAYLLKREGLSVAVLEKDQCGCGATGQSTAHVTAVPEARLRPLVDQFGADSTQMIWEAGFSALARIRSIVRDERINCRFGWVPAYLYASPLHNVAAARAEMAEDVDIANALGIDARIVDVVPGINRPGVAFDSQARLHPLSYLQVLASRIPGDGSHLFEGSEVTAVTDGPLTVHVGEYMVRTDYVIVATHWPIGLAMGGGRGIADAIGLSMATTYAVRGMAPHGELPSGLFWDNRAHGYEYLRVDRRGECDEILLGGYDRRMATSEDVSGVYAALEQRAAELAPRVRVSHRWSGPIIETADRLPLIGEVAPSRFVGTGFGGNGMAYGTLAAMMAVDAVHGRRNPWAPMFGLSRATGDQSDDVSTAPTGARNPRRTDSPWFEGRRPGPSGSVRRESVH